jgi:hypothetical protein
MKMISMMTLSKLNIDDDDDDMANPYNVESGSDDIDVDLDGEDDQLH